MYMVIIKLRVLKGNVYHEGVGATVLASDTFIPGKILTSWRGGWDLCVRWLFKWVGVYVFYYLMCTGRRRELKDLTEKNWCKLPISFKGSFLFLSDFKILICITTHLHVVKTFSLYFSQSFLIRGGAVRPLLFSWSWLVLPPSNKTGNYWGVGVSI